MCKSPASPEIPMRGHAHGAVEKRERSEQGLCGKIGQKAVNRKLLHIAQGVCRKIWAEKGRKGAADKLRPSPEWQAPPFRVIPRSEATWESRRTRLDNMALPAKSQLPSRDCHVGLRPPRNDKLDGIAPMNLCRKYCHPAGRSQSARGTPHP